MKKGSIIAMIALLAFGMNVMAQKGTEAQSETYNMIVTLPNGTTFTINTDDVESVTFTDGQITVSGATIERLLAEIKELQANDKDIISRVYDLQADMSMCAAEIKDVMNETQENAAQIDCNKLDIATLKYLVDNLTALTEKNSASIADDRAMISALQAMVNDLAARSNANNGEIDVIKAKLADLQAQTEINTERLDEHDVIIREQEELLNEVKNTFASQITALQAKVDALEQYIRSMQQ